VNRRPSWQLIAPGRIHRRDGKDMKNSRNEAIRSGCRFECGYTGQFCTAQNPFQFNRSSRRESAHLFHLE
jgi:hypothetical protein